MKGFSLTQVGERVGGKSPDNRRLRTAAGNRLKRNCINLQRFACRIAERLCMIPPNWIRLTVYPNYT